MMPQAPSDPTVAALLAEGRAALPGDDGARDAEWLLLHVLDRSRAWLFAHADATVDPARSVRYRALLTERAAGRPVAHLTGRRGFWTFDLQVTAATLIPRPETERLVEAALARIDPAMEATVADLGTGTGAIALALASERRRAHVIATDASADALEVARANAQRLGLRIDFRCGDWLAPLAGVRCHLIASNPPYIEDADPHLERGDLRFEPRSALASGADGLDAIRAIVRDAPAHLHPGGWLLFEHGWNQGAAVRALVQSAGFEDVQTLQDLESRDRVTLGRMAG